MLGLFVLSASVLQFFCFQVKAKDNYKTEKAVNLEDCNICKSYSSEQNNSWPKWPQGGNSVLHEKPPGRLTEQG